MTDSDTAGDDLHDLAPWFSPMLGLGASEIHGQGVFALAPIAAGDLVMRLGGALLPMALRYSESVLPSTSVGVAEGIILGERVGSHKDVSDYLNHSCSPNVGFRDAITLAAIQDIVGGEEVTIDYAFWEGDERWRLKSPCRCGATSCRGTVLGTDWRRADIRPQLSKWASPYLRRRIHAQQ